MDWNGWRSILALWECILTVLSIAFCSSKPSHNSIISQCCHTAYALSKMHSKMWSTHDGCTSLRASSHVDTTVMASKSIQYSAFCFMSQQSIWIIQDSWSKVYDCTWTLIFSIHYREWSANSCIGSQPIVRFLNHFASLPRHFPRCLAESHLSLVNGHF